MRPATYAQLLAVARRESRDAGAAEDLVQEAMVAGIRAGRTDFDTLETARWLAGVIRNQARMAARGAVRRRRRETAWRSEAVAETTPSEAPNLAGLVDALPGSLKIVAALALSGHNRREIAYLLDLSDTALRQRLAALKRRLVVGGVAAPEDLPGLNLDLAYGRLRDALLPRLLRHGGVFASHDPDGHLFVVSRSQIAPPRQQGTQTSNGGLP
ncbi:sigma factor [Caulobacter sp. 73W]|uniref:Sigma factor n=1 Tax=Caulobacter sp. 73W TaxID=3161137 RepID=A0AB39KQI7_9CAUL